MKSVWKNYKIGEFAKRFKKPTKVADDILYKRLTIRMHGLGIILRDEVAGSLIRTRNQFFAKGGQFLLSKIDARNGAFGILSQDLDGALISNSFQAYDLDENIINIDYFNYFTKTHSFIDFCSKASEGTTNRRTMDDNKFLTFEILLLPLPEQKRIVEKIKKIEEKIEELKKEKLVVSDRISKLVSSYSESLFGRLTESENLGDVTTRITKGESPKWQGFNYQNEGPLFVTSENVLWGNIDIKDAKHIPEKFHQKLKRSSIKKNDLLVNLVGASIGRAAIVDFDIGDANTNQAVAVITLDNKKYLPEYILAYLLSPTAQEIIHGSEVETARPNISLGDLRKLKIPKASLNIQNEIVTKIWAMKDEEENSLKLVNSNTTYISALMPSVLSRAFNGEL